MITFFDETLSTPAENLAADEALLDECEENPGRSGFVRFYESAEYFVVLGYGKSLERETYREECAARNIPILRRCSGGGTVLQGPGCFNYALILSLSYAPELGTITGANRFIMARVQKIVTEASRREVAVRGCTDLVLGDRKFSGNAQRRKQKTLLFHGSFLIDFDLDLMTSTLRLPEQQPEYRSQRTHADFVVNLPVNRRELQQCFLKAWNAAPAAAAPTLDSSIRKLVGEKYSQPGWNERF